MDSSVYLSGLGLIKCARVFVRARVCVLYGSCFEW